MPNILGRNLNLCFTMVNRPPLLSQNFNGSEDDHHHVPQSTPTGATNATTTSSSSSSTMYIKNYNTLYECFTTTPNSTTAITTNTTATHPPPAATCSNSSNYHNHSYSNNSESDFFSPTTISTSDSEPDTDMATAPTPDFATICASKRFFISSPGQSNSIIDSSSTSSSSSYSHHHHHHDSTAVEEENHESHDELPDQSQLINISSTTGGGQGVAVQTYSPDPYLDFRRSMQEMVEAYQLFDVKDNWDSLQELLLCYLSLNPKSTHKFIVGAFADLLVSLISVANASATTD